MSQKVPEGSPAPSFTSASGGGTRAITKRLYELSLYSIVPASRHAQLLQILAGVAGHPPNLVQERHIIFKPKRINAQASGTAQTGGSQTIQDHARRRRQESGKDGQSWLMRAVGSMTKDEHQANGSQHSDMRPEPDAAELPKWSWRWYGLPDPNMKLVTARPTEWNEMDPGDPTDFAETQNFQQTSQYLTEGEQFIHNNIVLFLHRICKWPLGVDHSQQISHQDLDPMDSSGDYLLEARVMLADGTKNELMSKGTNELIKFRDTLQGSIELRPADRLALDTRAR